MSDLWWLIAVVVVLVVLSIFDIRSRRIPVSGFVIIFVMSLMYRGITDGRDVDLLGVVWSVIPGLLLIGLSVLTERKIGMGDGILILVLGPGLGLLRCIYLLAGAFFLCCVFSGALLLLRKADRKTRIPFVPFITLGMGVMAIACG